MACLLAGLASVAASAQTADPSATTPIPATAAPAAKVGTYSVTQGVLLAAPGLRIPNGNLPWALDTLEGKQALVPIHHSAINEPANTDAAGSTPVTNHSLEGVHARTALHGLQPVFFIHANDRTENTGDAGRGNPTGWVLVEATVVDGKRSLPHVRFAQINQGTACTEPVVCLQAETLPDGWLRLSPKSAITPGDYALIPVPRQPKPGIVIVYDFQLDPGAPLAKDAIQAGQAPAPAGKRAK